MSVGTKRIIVVGGGFGGVACAKRLRRRLSISEAECVIFNRENHFVFTPLIADAVGSSLNPLDVVVPLRELLPKVRCRTEDVLGANLDANEVIYEGHDGQPRKMQYDHLVIACGRVANLNAVPGMADHAFPLKTIGDAVLLRAHVLRQLEKAEVCDDVERKRWLLSFIVVGGGYSGVEVAGEIFDLVRGSVRLFSGFAKEDVTVTLIHSQAQILPEISSTLRDFARSKMERAGIRFALQTRVVLATADGVRLSDGAFLRGGTIVCTVGTATAVLVERLDVQKEHGRLATGPDMRVVGRTNVWAVGDCATVINALDDKPSPPTGQFAEREGRSVAENVVKALREEPTLAFSFKPLGQLCSIGGHSAVAELFGVRVSGLLAWFLWRGTYLLKMPSWARRAQVGFDWLWALLFPRDLSHLKPSLTDRVTHAHYLAGDYVYREGDAAMHLYVCERGEVEVVRDGGSGDAEVIGVLGAGSFFGEQALIDESPRAASARARTDAEILVVGRNVFAQLSGALAPLRNALARNIAQGQVGLWRDRPELIALLEKESVAALVEPVPQPLLRGDVSLRDLSGVFARQTDDMLLVSNDGERLDGIVSLDDLMHAYVAGGRQLKTVADVMTKSPVRLAPEDSCLVAANILLVHGLKGLPVVDRRTSRLVGVLSTRALIARTLAIAAAPGRDPDGDGIAVTESSTTTMSAEGKSYGDERI